MTAPTLYLVAPTSLASWLAHFVPRSAGDEVVYTGEGPQLELAPLAALLGTPGDRVIVFLSSHDTLIRDNTVAEALRRKGFTVVAQSGRCALLGADKFAMKAFFDENSFASPQWAMAGSVSGLGRPDRLLVVKDRRGTQSIGTRLERLRDCVLMPAELCELYTDGVEYSVLIYRDDLGCAVFPPVWKGRTSPALIPPWRRLRLCPFDGLTARVDRALREMSQQIADAAQCEGFMEAEFLVTDSGELNVLEINPRVSGTMRISAMATRVPVFAMHKLPELRQDLTAVRHAAEIPYSGEPFCDPEQDIFATSRLTVAADSAAGLGDRLRQLGYVAADDVGGPAPSSVPPCDWHSPRPAPAAAQKS